MKNVGRVPLFIWLFVGILHLVFPKFGFCSNPSSFTVKVGTSDKNVDPGYSYKYFMQSYYKKYENLGDCDYKDFIAKELPIGLCDFLPNSPNLVPRLIFSERNLIGEGSHRQIATSLKIRLGLESISDMSKYSCGVVVIERLPLGVFADPFELQHLLQRGVFSDIGVFGDTNLESPSFLSNRSAVEIHMNLDRDTLRHKEAVEIKLKLPLHARYAPLNETGYSQVRFDEPDLFLQCSVKEKSSNQSCLYVIEREEFQYGEMVWKIPSGRKAHSEIVYIFTFISASLAALVIVFTSICHSSVTRCKSLKQS